MAQDDVFPDMLIWKKLITYKALVDITTDLIWKRLISHQPGIWRQLTWIYTVVYTLKRLPGRKWGNVNYQKGSAAAYILILNQIPTQMIENVAPTAIIGLLSCWSLSLPKLSHWNVFRDWAPVDFTSGARFSNEFRRPDMTGYQDSSQKI